jgi:hypothetical protein
MLVSLARLPRRTAIELREAREGKEDEVLIQRNSVTSGRLEERRDEMIGPACT